MFRLHEKTCRFLGVRWLAILCLLLAHQGAASANEESCRDSRFPRPKFCNSGARWVDVHPAFYRDEFESPEIYWGSWSFTQSFENVGREAAASVEWRVWVDSESGLELATDGVLEAPQVQRIDMPWGRGIEWPLGVGSRVYSHEIRGRFSRIDPGQRIELPVSVRVPIREHGRVVSVNFEITPRDATGDAGEILAYPLSYHSYPEYGPNCPGVTSVAANDVLCRPRLRPGS